MKEHKGNVSLTFLLGLFFALIALAMTVHADTGVYNYNISINVPHRIYAIGEDMQIVGFVSYNNLTVKEYPCVLTFYDWRDNHTIYSTRLYTDELGQFLYSGKTSDIFMYNNNYSYSVMCSNTTKFGSVFVPIGTTPIWFMNYPIYFNENMDWIILFVILSLFGLVILGFYAHASGWFR